jgi:hypothetical protein
LDFTGPHEERPAGQSDSCQSQAPGWLSLVQAVPAGPPGVTADWQPGLTRRIVILLDCAFFD